MVASNNFKEIGNRSCHRQPETEVNTQAAGIGSSPMPVSFEE